MQQNMFTTIREVIDKVVGINYKKKYYSSLKNLIPRLFYLIPYLLSPWNIYTPKSVCESVETGHALL